MKAVPLPSIHNDISTASDRCGTRFKHASVLATVFALATTLVFSSDHADVPTLEGAPRHDANLTDLHAFCVGSNLVVAVSSNPAIPPGETHYHFPTDVTFEIKIDNDSAVSADDPLGMGGTVLNPDMIQEDITVRIRFDEEGVPLVWTFARERSREFSVQHVFAGLRDDPFIRGPRTGRNVAAIVIEIPLAWVVEDQSTLLIWATTKMEEVDGVYHDLVGRALRSMMPENNDMNGITPRHQPRKLGVPPDVMIYDTALPAAYPNGRALTDDVVDLIGDPRVLSNDAPFPSENDTPFLEEFPYLAPPHLE